MQCKSCGTTNDRDFDDPKADYCVVCEEENRDIIQQIQREEAGEDGRDEEEVDPFYDDNDPFLDGGEPWK